jgi:acyl-CoA reductase-like NAD-dependent aldehyde dehydrogenase
MSPEPYPPLKFDEFSNIVDGKPVHTTRTRHAVNPSTLAANPEVPASTQRDVDEAVIAAREAFDAWSQTPIGERRQAILDLSESLEELKDDFARLLTLEQGKPLVAARSEVDAAIHWLRTQAKLEFPTEAVEDSEHQRISTVYSPLGVAVAIVPWNCMNHYP